MSGENHAISQAAWGTFLYIAKVAIKIKHTITQAHFLTPCKNKHFIPSGLKGAIVPISYVGRIKRVCRTEKYVAKEKRRKKVENMGMFLLPGSVGNKAAKWMDEAQYTYSVVSWESKLESTILMKNLTPKMYIHHDSLDQKNIQR